MKAAFAHWNQRIAPVFDVAREVAVVEVRDGQVVGERFESLPEQDPTRRALRLAELGVELLVCGAISRPLHSLVSSYGIRVMPFMSGDLGRIVSAWAQGDLTEESFAMPGCRGGGRRRRRGCGRGGAAAGAGGTCRCTRCGHEEPHERGVPCTERTCPKCGSSLVRV